MLKIINMEGYIYLGEHYDVLGREINITDKKSVYQLTQSLEKIN